IEQRAGNLGVFEGRLSADFTISGELVALRLGNPYSPGLVAPLQLEVAFGIDNEILIREDRDPANVGPRCYRLSDGPWCPDPVVLYRVEDPP
ncbi:MAG: hypothetical protein ACRDFR_08990, partial [Candidatus Limnocylindria bacterium]